MPTLNIEPISKTAFAAFGEVITLDGAQHFPINQGTTERFHALAEIDAQDKGGRAIISLFRAQPRTLPMAVCIMERHPLGSQAFVPVTEDSQAEYLVLVAPAGEFSASQMRAFIVRGFVGVNYAKGVWHHPLIALHKVSDFLVMDRIGLGNNCEEITLDGSVVLDM